MPSTVIGLYDRRDEAREVVQELEQRGFARDHIQCVEPGAEKGLTEGSPGWTGARSADAGAMSGENIEDILRTYGLPDDMAHQYAEGVHHGGTLVAVRTPDDQTEEAANILDRHHPIDIDERARHWDEEGGLAAGETTETSTAPPSTTPLDESSSRAETRAGGEEERIPVVEEKVDIGKRRVESGGVRVYSHIVEEPVEKQVELSEEHVEVQRRKVDRPVTNAEDAFQERTIEARESREEPVISKEARVIEEIVIDTETTGRTETVRDTARRTEVDIEQAGGEQLETTGRREADLGPAGGERPDYARTDVYDTADREHFGSSFMGYGFTYEQAAPAYRFGHRLAEDERYQNRDWSEVVPEARRMFEMRNPGQWDTFEPAVRYGYEQARDRKR